LRKVLTITLAQAVGDRQGDDDGPIREKIYGQDGVVVTSDDAVHGFLTSPAV
jgi:hypothetical protein